MNRIRPLRRGLHSTSAALLVSFSFALSLEASASPPTPSGLVFALTLSNSGRSVSNDRFTLKVPGTKGALVLTFEGAGLVGATFASPVRLKNDSDADLFALRVDLVSASEAAAASPNTTRLLQATASSPPAWDVVKRGEESSAQLFRAGPVGFSPERGLVILLGAVSGVASAGAFEVEGAKSPTALETDAADQVYVTDVSGRVICAGPDGSQAEGVRAAPTSPPEPTDGPCARYRAAGKPCRASPDGRLFVIEGREVSEFAPPRRSRPARCPRLRERREALHRDCGRGGTEWIGPRLPPVLARRRYLRLVLVDRQEMAVAERPPLRRVAEAHDPDFRQKGSAIWPPRQGVEQVLATTPTKFVVAKASVVAAGFWAAMQACACAALSTPVGHAPIAGEGPSRS